MKILSIALLSIIFYLPLQSYAKGVANTYKVEHVRIDNTGRGYVSFEVPLIGDVTGCIDQAYNKVLAFDTNTDGGKAIMSMALTAKVSGKRIYAKGTGECSIYPKVAESWGWGKIVD